MCVFIWKGNVVFVIYRSIEKEMISIVFRLEVGEVFKGL